ncbi:MAG: hypothetical protein ACPG49_00335 [Chitinophagales bacterium]
MAEELYIPKSLYNEVDKTYLTDELEKRVKPLVFNFLNHNGAICISEGVPLQLYAKVHNRQQTKEILIKLCCIPFLTEKLVSAFKETLPEEFATVFDALIWNEKLSGDVIKSRFDISISSVNKSRRSWIGSSRELKGLYSFFLWKPIHRIQEHEHHTLYLLPGFRKLLMENSSKPENYYLRATELEKTDFIYCGEKDIFLELPRLLAYYEEGNIKTTTKTRPISSTLNKMQKKLNLAEFFEDTKEDVLKNLRVNAIASLLVLIEKKNYDRTYENWLKKVFDLYQKKNYYISLPRLLTHIKGLNYVEDYDLNSIEPYIYQILQEMPLDSWVSYENIEESAYYRIFKLEPIEKNLASSRLYFSEGKIKYYVKKTIYHKAIIQPTLKANFFLLAAFGLVEIAYNQPDTFKITETYLSPYDGLRFVKLSNLGAYIVGKKQEYKQIEGTERKPLILSPDSLMILSDETDSVADILLQKYTKKVGANRYQTDLSTFLKKCSTRKELEDKIEGFMNTVSIDLPSNWETFFEELIDKINPFESVGDDFLVLKISPTNRELIQLIAQDVVLKKLVLKGEGFLIFVPKTNLTQFRNRLKEFGFLFSNLF